MDSEVVPTIVAIVLALVGGAGGFAALLKVNADNSKTVSDGAASVVKMLRDEIASMDDRLRSVEQYASDMEDWGAKMVELVERAVDMLPEPYRIPFRSEADRLGASRPRRRKTDRSEH
jgi:hypothetical protein